MCCHHKFVTLLVSCAIVFSIVHTQMMPCKHQQLLWVEAQPSGHMWEVRAQPCVQFFSTGKTRLRRGIDTVQYSHIFLQISAVLRFVSFKLRLDATDRMCTFFFPFDQHWLAMFEEVKWKRLHVHGDDEGLCLGICSVLGCFQGPESEENLDTFSFGNSGVAKQPTFISH